MMRSAAAPDRRRTDEQVLRAAWYYYKDELTQDEIARRMSISRASVGRMLERARKTDLVTITISADFLTSLETAARLCETFGLAEAVVVPDDGKASPSQRAINARLGLGGAEYLASQLRPGVSVGVGWGDTVSRVIAAIDLSAVGQLNMVTLTGGVDGYLQALAYSRGDPGTLTASVIPSPIVTSTPELAASLRAEPTIQRVLHSARDLRLAVVGVGTAAPDSTLVQMGYLSLREARSWTKKGLAGDILGQFFDLDGRVLDLPIHDRRIGIELSDLRRIDRVVGVAGGLAKVDAILGALHGGYLDVLVTDESVALELLKRQN
jgi:lsr operon transcriptional repressor